MLILTRKKNESIKINENIEITILDMDNGSVKIGINAPRSVRILRSELTQKIQASNSSIFFSSSKYLLLGDILNPCSTFSSSS